MNRLLRYTSLRPTTLLLNEAISQRPVHNSSNQLERSLYRVGKALCRQVDHNCTWVNVAHIALEEVVFATNVTFYLIHEKTK